MRFLMSQAAPQPGQELVAVSNDGSDPVPVSLVQVGSVQMPSWFEAHLVDNDNGDPDVIFEFQVRNGVPECRRLTIIATEDGHEVRCSGLAGIRVEDVLEEAIKRLIRGMPTVGDGRVNWPMLYPSGDDKRSAIRSTRRARAARKVKITTELLQEVADVYRANVSGGHPTAAVAAHFDKAHRTATLYVKRARDAGYLGAAAQGKAGEL